jgi:hypothetical protein
MRREVEAKRRELVAMYMRARALRANTPAELSDAAFNPVIATRVVRCPEALRHMTKPQSVLPSDRAQAAPSQNEVNEPDDNAPVAPVAIE